MPPPVLIGEPSPDPGPGHRRPGAGQGPDRAALAGPADHDLQDASPVCGWISATPRAPSRCGCPTTSWPGRSSGAPAPMAVSSANLSGQPAALTCDEAIDQLGDQVSVYLDGGRAGESGRAPSTIVDFTQPSDEGEVLRRRRAALEAVRPGASNHRATTPDCDGRRGRQSQEPIGDPRSPPTSVDREPDPSRSVADGRAEPETSVIDGAEWHSRPSTSCGSLA